MTKISSEAVQKSAEAVAILYANWPAFRVWVRGRMASGSGSRQTATRCVSLPAWEVEPGELEGFLERWHERAGDAWTPAGKLAEFAVQSPAVIAYIEAGHNAVARTRRMASVLRALADRPLPWGGRVYRLEREKRRTDRHKPRWRLVGADAGNSGEDAMA